MRTFIILMLLLVAILAFASCAPARSGCFPTGKYKQTFVPHSRNPKGFM